MDVRVVAEGEREGLSGGGRRRGWRGGGPWVFVWLDFARVWEDSRLKGPDPSLSRGYEARRLRGVRLCPVSGYQLGVYSFGYKWLV